MNGVFRSGPPHATTDTNDADVLAAGAVLWRPGTRGPELGLVHRPRYDDWSFPKGKLDAGETLPFAAVREVAEETGQRVRLGPALGDVHYPVPEGQKLVRYWGAEALGGEFVPGDETDELRWVGVQRAADMLSYRHDLEVLQRFAEVGIPSSVVLLVRHAKAGSRGDWDGDDDLRPLSEAGREQVRRLTGLLPLFGPERIASAPLVRCRDSVAPLAETLGLAVLDEPLLGEHAFYRDIAAGLARFRELAKEPGVTVVCSQGGVIPDLVAALATGADVSVDPEDVPAKKGSTWALTFCRDAELCTADYYPRPTG
ncbi:NUDIX hydrolase [Pseudonocardia yunnanensis]|uniref:NUDIX domain-containing protein n=1 Tax=Pseudonocardia yunnanensis TaxID=58107 RepID=A0ABW4F7B5_9PSEU